MASRAASLPVVRPDASPRQAGLDGWKLAAFSSFAIPIAASQMPLAVYLPAIYAQDFGVPLATLGMIFLIERLWGAVADPMVGMLSDRTRSRFGRRKPWIVAGAALYAAAGIALFFPSGPVSPLGLGIALMLFYLGLSMMQIPHLAWSGELSGGYNERTRIATFGTVAAAAALLIVLLLPTLIDQFRPDDAPLKLAAFGVVTIGSLAVTLPLVLRSFPEGPPPAARPRTSLRIALRAVLGDRLLVRVMASDFAVTFGQLVRSTLFVFFVTSYMGLPRWASGLFLLQFVFGVAAGPIWMRIGMALGKHRAAVLGELVQVAINLGLLLVKPGMLPLLLALTVAQGLAQGSGNLMLRAIVADVADRHRLITGEDRAALFFSIFSLTSKGAMAAAAGVALPLVAWIGFVPGGPNNAHALTGLLLLFALGPAVAHLVSAGLLIGFPLDRQSHSDIRRALARRDRALSDAGEGPATLQGAE